MSACSAIASALAGKMTLTVDRTACGREYTVRDVSRADFGRLQIQLAESEMPGLIACRKEFGASQPLRGARITGCLHLTAPTAVLVETLTALGASVRWCSSDAFSTEDHVAAAVARDSASVFAWKGQSIQALDWGQLGGPDLLIDDAGDATLFIHEGVRAEEEHERCGKLPADQGSSVLSQFFDNERSRVILQLIRDAINANPRRFRKTQERLVGVSIQTSVGIRRLFRLQENANLLFPAFNISGASTTKSIDEIHGVHQSSIDGLMRALDHVALGGKVAVVVGYGRTGKGCAMGLKGAGARVIVVEINPIRALEALMEGFNVRNFENVVPEGDVFITATGNRDVITVDHMRRMKNNAIVGNLGQFANEIDVEGLKNSPCVRRIVMKPFVSDLFFFQDSDRGIIVLAEGRKFNFASAPGNPSFVRSLPFTSHVMAQIELWNERRSPKYEQRVYLLPRVFDEKVARLHLDQLGAELSQLNREQATYVNISIEGPFKLPKCGCQGRQVR
ncbi:hypothetical protein V2J09_011952 [Rumex salicifolius]